MSDGIEFFSSDDLESNIGTVMAQTNYTREDAIAKLKLFNSDSLMVIRDFMGIPLQKPAKIKSVNQSVYTHIRTTLDHHMKEYRDAHPINVDQLTANIQESEAREKVKKE